MKSKETCVTPCCLASETTVELGSLLCEESMGGKHSMITPMRPFRGIITACCLRRPLAVHLLPFPHMLHEIFKARLGKLRTELKRRDEWPLIEPQPLDPCSGDPWKRFTHSGAQIALLSTERIPADLDDVGNYLREHYNMPHHLTARYGYARPYLLWLTHANVREVSITPLHRCTAIDYLECEDSVAGLETLQAWLSDGN